jgi:hypothetical protein
VVVGTAAMAVAEAAGAATAKHNQVGTRGGVRIGGQGQPGKHNLCLRYMSLVQDVYGKQKTKKEPRSQPQSHGLALIAH